MTKTKSLPAVMRRGFFSWLTAVLIEYVRLPVSGRELFGTENIENLSLGRIAVIALLLFGLLSAINRIGSTQGAERWGLLAVFCILSAVAVRESFRGSFLGACVMVLLILLLYTLRGWNGSEASLQATKEKTQKGPAVVIVILSGIFFLFLCLWTVSRVYSFSAPTYDFGIFSQMFYSMRTVGQPLTTLERDGLLSHFAVHVSPIYYLLLPLYAVAPYPATLQVLQAMIVTSSVIPLWKLGKLHGFGRWERVLLCGSLLLYPAFSGGVGYDLHENCFLTPLLLWVFYGIEKGRPSLIFPAAILVLSVKEDAPVYVAVIGLWLLLQTCLRSRERKDIIIALSLFVLAVLWFFAATAYLKNRGEGVMSGRYSNLMEESSGSLFLIIRCALANPMKLLYECSDPEKLRYLALTMVPLLGMPLITRRFERYLLLIPYVLINLMSDYQYQHEIFYQYSFGSTAFLLYLTVLNGADIRCAWGKTGVLLAMTVLCSVSFSLLIVPKAIFYPTAWMQQREELRQVRQALAAIPEDKTVTASTFYTTELSQRQTLYDLGYASREHLLDSEYVVIDPLRAFPNKKYASPGKKDGLQNLLALLHKQGYERIAAMEDRLYIYRKATEP